MGSLHSWPVWALYFAGALLHILSNANRAVRSKANAVTTYGQYFRLQGIPLLSRTFLCTLAFVAAWENPKLMNLENLPLTAAMRFAMAGFFGWCSDSLLEHVMALIPGAQKELPTVDDAK